MLGDQEGHVVKIVDLQEMYMKEDLLSLKDDKVNQKRKSIPSTARLVKNTPREVFEKYSYPDVKNKDADNFMPLKTIISCKGYEERTKLEKDVIDKRKVASECIEIAFQPVTQKKEPIILVVPSYAIMEACLDVQCCVENNGSRILHVIPRCMATAFSYYEKDKKLESRYNVVDIGDGALSISTVLVREQTVAVETRHVDESHGYWNIVSDLEYGMFDQMKADHKAPDTDEEHWEVYKKAKDIFKKGRPKNDEEIIFGDYIGNTKEVQERYTGNVGKVVQFICDKCKKDYPLLLCGYLQASEFGKSVKDQLEKEGWSDALLLDGDENGIDGAGKIFFGDVELFYHANPWNCCDDSRIYSLHTGSMRLFPTHKNWKVQSCDRIWGSVSLVGGEADSIEFMIAKTKHEQYGGNDEEQYEKSKLMKIPIIKADEERGAGNIMLETFVVNRNIIYYHIVDKTSVYTSLRRFDFRVDFKIDSDGNLQVEECVEE